MSTRTAAQNTALLTPKTAEQTPSGYAVASPEKRIESTVDPLFKIKCLDFNMGMQCAANNRSLYEKLLKAFAENNRDTVAKVRSAITAQDQETARRTIHSLKGLAATIGARELQMAARNTEDALICGKTDIALKILKTVDELMEFLLMQIRLAFGPDIRDTGLQS